MKHIPGLIVSLETAEEKIAKIVKLLSKGTAEFETPLILSIHHFLSGHCNDMVFEPRFHRYLLDDKFGMEIIRGEKDGMDNKGHYVSFVLYNLDVAPKKQPQRLVSLSYTFHTELGTFSSIAIGKENEDYPTLSFDTMESWLRCMSRSMGFVEEVLAVMDLYTETTPVSA